MLPRDAVSQTPVPISGIKRENRIQCGLVGPCEGNSPKRFGNHFEGIRRSPKKEKAHAHHETPGLRDTLWMNCLLRDDQVCRWKTL